MSDFVNYKKRDITLPRGWKDLVQVLHAKGDSSAGDESQPEYSHCEIIKPLSQIERYISLVFDCRTPLSLNIVPFADRKLEFTIRKLPSDGLRASVQVRMGTEAEAGVRRFLQIRGFSVPDNSVPTMFNPNLPVELFCDIAPLPPQVEQVSNLVTDLFREVCGLNDQSELAFGYSVWNQH